MIVGGRTEARAQLSSTIINYHEPFDQGLTVSLFLTISEMWLALALMSAPNFYDVPDFETCSLNWLPTLLAAIFLA